MRTRFAAPLAAVLVAASLVGSLGLLHAAERQPRKLAFLVGVSSYDHNFGNLNYAERDVAELAKALKTGGYEVVILTGSADGKDRATRKQIEARLAALLQGDGDDAKKVRKDDLFLLILSGHGQELEVADPKNKDQKRLETFFAPVDGKKGDPATLFSISHALDDLLVPTGATTLLLVDACRDIYDPNKGKGINGEHVNLKGKTAVLFSCAEGEQSWESRDIEHSVFSFAVLEALRAATDNNEELTWNALVSDVEKRMRSAKLRKLIPEKKTQRPVLASGQIPSIMLLEQILRPTALTPPFGEKEARASQAAWAKYLGRKVEEEIDLGGGVKLVLVLIPPGKFQMGSPQGETDRQENEELHDVEITKPFYLGKYPVTQAQYEALAGENPSTFSTKSEREEYRKLLEGLDTKQFPVDNVSWDMASAWCAHLTKKDGKRSYRLPREAEWEYACRAGTTSAFYFGNVLNGRQTNCVGQYPYGTEEKGPYLGRPSRVGIYGENSWGLGDMHGNVYQWCLDYYGPYKGLDERDPVRMVKHSDNNRRVLRGGSWNHLSGCCRAAFRGRSAPDDRINYFGFRVCLPLD